MPSGNRAPALYSVEGGKLSLTFHDGQARAWDSQARFVFAIAGTQGGKTSWGPWWLWREIMNCGSGDYLAVTSTFPLFNNKMLPELIKVFVHVLKIGRYWAQAKIIEIKNPETGKFEAKTANDAMWARIMLASASAPDGLEAATAKAAWLDECGQSAFSLDTWDAILRRLSIHQGRVLGTTTPYNLGWLKTTIVDKAASDPDIEVISFPSIDNPLFSMKEFKKRRREMPRWKFNMFYMGRFERPAGLIYGDFKPSYREEGGHKVKPFELPIEWPRYVGVDPGAINTAMIWLAHDTEKNIFYLYRESLEGNKSTKEHAQGAFSKAERNNERVIMWYVGQKSEKQTRLDWQEAGVLNVSEPVIHEVESGIDRVTELIKPHRLYIFDTCLGVLDEISRYGRKLDEDGEPTEVIEFKDTYHRLDALRYAAVGVTAPQGIFFD